MKGRKAACGLLAALLAWSALVCGAFAADPQLDVQAFRTNAARWMAAAEGVKPEDILARMEVQRVVPVERGPLQLFAVRISVRPPHGVDGVPKVGNMLVDRTGAYRFSGMTDLPTGADLVRGAMDEAMRFDLPGDFGRTLAEFGGGHEVVVVSDPFCPHCRRQWAELRKLRKRIGALKVVHLPLVGGAGSEALGWAVDYARSQGMDALKISDFIMSSMEPPGGGVFKGQDAAVGALEDLFKQFPEFRKRLGAPEAALEILRGGYSEAGGRDRARTWRYGLGSVPCAFIDGILVRGFNPVKLQEMLGK